MKRLMPFVALLTAGFAALADVPIHNAHPGTGAIVVLGDSLASGYGANNVAVKPAGCLENFFHQKPVDLSFPGLTSGQILTRDPDAAKAKPALIFVSSGGNDAISDYFKKGSYPETQTLAEMDKMFDDLLATGAVVAYLGLNPPLPAADRLPKVSDLARSKGVIVVDGMAGLWTDKAKMFDQFHPNDSGYAIMCDRITQAVQGYYP